MLQRRPQNTHTHTHGTLKQTDGCVNQTATQSICRSTVPPVMDHSILLLPLQSLNKYQQSLSVGVYALPYAVLDTGNASEALKFVMVASEQSI